MYILLPVDHFNTYVRRNGLESRAGTPIFDTFSISSRASMGFCILPQVWILAANQELKPLIIVFPPKPSLHYFLSLCSFSTYHFPSGFDCPFPIKRKPV